MTSFLITMLHMCLDSYALLNIVRKTKAVENILEEKQKRRKMAKESTVDRNIEQKLEEKSKFLIVVACSCTAFLWFFFKERSW